MMRNLPVLVVLGLAVVGCEKSEDPSLSPPVSETGEFSKLTLTRTAPAGAESTGSVLDECAAPSSTVDINGKTGDLAFSICLVDGDDVGRLVQGEVTLNKRSLADVKHALSRVIDQSFPGQCDTENPPIRLDLTVGGQETSYVDEAHHCVKGMQDLHYADELDDLLMVCDALLDDHAEEPGTDELRIDKVTLSRSYPDPSLDCESDRPESFEIDLENQRIVMEYCPGADQAVVDATINLRDDPLIIQQALAAVTKMPAADCAEDGPSTELTITRGDDSITVYDGEQFCFEAPSGATYVSGLADLEAMIRELVSGG